MKFTFQRWTLQSIIMTSIHVFLLQVLCVTLVFANDTHGQTENSVRKISFGMEFKQAELKTIFEKIEEETKLTFVYQKKILRQTAPISYNNQKGSVYDLLLHVSKEAGLSFLRVNDIINVKKTPGKTSVVREFINNKEITGKVTDEDGVPLPNATVRIGDSYTGTVTNSRGEFRVTVPENVTTLTISFVGYKSVTVSIDETEMNIVMQPDAAVLGDFVVSGIRASLNKALDIKKQAVNGVDAIVAEDIAKFPQTNVSEALQRVSGIQIRRDYEGGVGNDVSVRGLPAEYTQVTLNGQAAPNSSDGRTYNFNALPAELFSKVEVFKSPTANLDEGGIGGVVNLVTRKPFDLDKRVMVASLEGVYHNQGLEESVTPRMSFTYGDKWNDKFGLITGVSYSKFFSASQSYDNVRFRDYDFDLNNDGIDEFQGIRVPFPRFISQAQEVERLTFNAAAQYKVNDNFNLLLEAVYTNNNQIQTRYTPIWFTQGRDASALNVDGNFLIEGTFTDVTLRSENQQQDNDTDIYQFALTGRWFANDWNISANVNYQANNRDSERFRFYADNVNDVTYSVAENTRWFDIRTTTDLSDPSQFTMSEARRWLWDNNDDIFSAQIDLSRDLSSTFKTSFGAKYRSRTKARQHWYRRVRNLDDPFGPVSMILTDWLDRVEYDFHPSELAVHDWDKAKATYATQLDLTDAEVINAGYNITEDITAGYVMGDWSLPKFDLNFGIRLVNTSLTSTGFELDETTDVLSPREVTTSYFDALPSVNFRYKANENLFLKGSFARVITRPTLGNLSAYREIDDVNLTIAADNPELDPFRANQYEVSMEWYPVKESFIGLSFFRKDIESFITNETRDIPFNGNTYTLSRPVNGNNATVQGIEVNYQQPFTFLPGFWNGFGVVLNYTLADSDFEEVVDLESGETETYPLPNNSKHSYNLIAYYEKYGFSFRIAHNYRDRFLRSAPNPVDGLKYRHDYNQTDISASYELNKTWTVMFNVLNAFDSERYEYIGEFRFQDNASLFGTQFQFGVRASF